MSIASDTSRTSELRFWVTLFRLWSRDRYRRLQISFEVKLKPMQAVRPSQVPEYLHTSGFYLGLNVTDDDEFFIPINHMKLNTNVDTLADMTELLNTIRFWGIDIFPQALINCAARHPFAEIMAVLEPYRADLPFVTTVCSIFSESADANIHVEMAMGSGNLDVVHYFHKQGEPFSARAIALAAGKGALDCLQYATSSENRNYKYHLSNSVFAEAVRNGCMDDILFLRQNGYSLWHYGGWVDDVDLVNVAASSGQCGVLKYLHKQGCPIYSAAIAAADAGHFDCLEYAMQNGALLRGESINEVKGASLAHRLARANYLDLFPRALSSCVRIDTQTALFVARSGNLECLKLSIEHGARSYINLIVAVTERGHLSCLQYLHNVFVVKAVASRKRRNWFSYAASYGSGSRSPGDVAQLAAEAQQWGCLQFLITHGCPMNKPLTTSLVQASQLELYHLATAHGCKVSVWVACHFIKRGDTDLLQHALDHGCARSEEILLAAARHGQLQCLIYAHAQGCPWSAQVTLAAARGGYLECLQYLHEQGCPWDARVRCTEHRQYILDYADAHNCPMAI